MKKLVVYRSWFIIFLTLSSLLLIVNLFPKPSFAACQPSALNQGLISGLSITGGTIGNVDQTCVLDPQAAYRDYKIPSYEELENQFYTLSRSGVKSTLQLPNGDLNFAGNGVFLQTSNMSISSVAGSGVQIIFIRGNLNITDNITYADTDSYSGLVFVASGDINIYSTVTKVNAVLISSGKICTAYNFVASNCLDGTIDTPQLIVNGSLISLNKTNLDPGTSAIQLRRNLVNNNLGAAEVINKQPKYLYLLRNGLFTKDLILTEEDKSYGITPDPGPAPPPPPPPQPVCSGSINPFVIETLKDVVDCIIGI